MDPMSLQGDEHTGAAHLYVKETIDMYLKKGVQLLAITRNDNVNKPDQELFGGGSKLIRFTLGSKTIEHKSFFWKKENETLSKINEILEKENFTPDLIHAVYWYSGIVALPLSEKFNIPLIYTTVSLGKIKNGVLGLRSEHDIGRENAEQEIMRKALRIISVCEQERENCVKLYGISKEKIAVVGRGIDPLLFRNILKDREYFLFVGRMIDSKGISFLLSIYKSLFNRLKGVEIPRLVLVGGTQNEILKIKNDSGLNEIASTDFEKHITWMGIQPREKMPSFYNRAIITCVTSIYEPAARVILESMACGTPVIMTPTGYSDELVFDGTNGFVCPHGDLEGWCSRLSSLILDPIWASILGKRAQASVLPHFSIESFQERQWNGIFNIRAENTDLKKSLSSIKTIYPFWTVDEPMNTFEKNELLDEIKLGFPGWQITELDNSNASSLLFRIENNNESFFVKRFLNKRFFYSRFLPNSSENNLYKSAQARYSAQLIACQDELFLKPIKSDEKNYLFFYPWMQEKVSDEFKIDSFRDHFVLIDRFHKRNKTNFSNQINEYLMIFQDFVLNKNFLKYDQRTQQLNSCFRKGLCWHTPVSLFVEQLRYIDYLQKEAFFIDENHKRKSLAFLMKSVVSPTTSATVNWGGCRPQHFIYNDNCGQWFAVDGETICLGEPDKDYSDYLWWTLGLKDSSDFITKKSLAQKILSSFPIETQERILIWMWMRTFEQYLFDQYSGRKARLSRFSDTMDQIANYFYSIERKSDGTVF